MAKLSTLQLLRLFKKARSLSDVPDIHDEAACRRWLRELVDVLQDVVPQTETPVDDEVVNLLALIAEDDTTWDQAYKLMFLIVTHGPLPPRLKAAIASQAGCRAETVADTIVELSELFTP